MSNGGNRSKHRAFVRRACVKYLREVIDYLMFWPVCTLSNFFYNDTAFLLELFIRQGRIKKHVRLDIHPLLDVLLRHEYHVIGIIRAGMGVVISTVKIHLIVNLFLCTCFCAVEQEVFEEMG